MSAVLSGTGYNGGVGVAHNNGQLCWNIFMNDPRQQLQGRAGTGFGTGLAGFMRRAVTAFVVLFAVLCLFCMVMSMLFGLDKTLGFLVYSVAELCR
jgi:hypothetical protein